MQEQRCGNITFRWRVNRIRYNTTHKASRSHRTRLTMAISPPPLRTRKWYIHSGRLEPIFRQLGRRRKGGQARRDLVDNITCFPFPASSSTTCQRVSPIWQFLVYTAKKVLVSLPGVYTRFGHISRADAIGACTCIAVQPATLLYEICPLRSCSAFFPWEF